MIDIQSFNVLLVAAKRNRRTSRRTSGERQDKAIEKEIYKSKNFKLYKESKQNYNN